MKQTLLVLLLAVSVVGCAGKRAKYAREINRQHDAALIPADAPLQLDEFATRAFKDRFKKEVCELPDSPPEADRVACHKRYIETIQHRSAEVYPMANPAVVDAKCAAHPIECKEDHRNLERWTREAHNAAVEASRAEKLNQLDAWLAAQKSSRTPMPVFNPDAFRNMSQTLSPKKTNCTSTPNIMGGFNTTCQ